MWPLRSLEGLASGFHGADPQPQALQLGAEPQVGQDTEIASRGLWLLVSSLPPWEPRLAPPSSASVVEGQMV